MTASAEPNFEGHAERECGEHRTVGPHRAWCHDCAEWCYPAVPCRGCQVNEDNLVCDQCDGDPNATIVELRHQLAETERQRDDLAGALRRMLTR